MGLKEQFDAIKQDEEMKAMRLEIARLHQVISCAVCEYCGDEIADAEWAVNDDDHLVHEKCLKQSNRYIDKRDNG